MFSAQELNSLDRDYFIIICADEYDVTVISRNTRHMWYIHNTDYPGDGDCIIFHKHKASHPYHQHSRSHTLRQAIKGIKEHDAFQMNGRKPVK